LNQDASRFPLAWPRGWPRTAFNQRRRAPFRARGAPVSAWESVVRLTRELRLLGTTEEILSTNVRLRLDGWPRSDIADPEDRGAAVYFELKKKDVVLACDRWLRVADNIAALAQHIDALRRIERYGVGRLEQAFAGYAALPAHVEQWWDLLELDSRVSSIVEVDVAYKRLAKLRHPDNGGSQDAMAKLNEARELARVALLP
jgi:hypothetical protein